MSERIYIVIASHGEYSDRVEYPVAAFGTKMVAQDFVRAATNLRDEIINQLEAHGFESWDYCHPDELEPYDEEGERQKRLLEDGTLLVNDLDTGFIDGDVTYHLQTVRIDDPQLVINLYRHERRWAEERLHEAER